MLHTRDAQSYPLHGVDVVHERPKPKYPLRDLVKLWQEAKQREEEADRRAEHWHRAYNSLEQDYLALKDRDLCLSCQRVKDETEEGKTVKLCHECSTGCETRKSLELKLDKVYQDLRYWQEIKKQNTGRNSLCFPVYYKKSFHFFPFFFREGRKKNFFFSSTNEQAPVPEPTPHRLECALERLNCYRP